MKKKSIYLLVIIVAVMLLLMLGATKVEATTSGDWEYTKLDDSTAEITKYNGSATSIFIPNAIDDLKVVSIGENAIDFEEFFDENSNQINSITFCNRSTVDEDGYISIYTESFTNTDYAPEEFSFFVITDEDEDVTLATTLFEITGLNTFAGMPYFYSEENGNVFDWDAETISINTICSNKVLVKIPSEVPYINDNLAWSSYSVGKVDCECGKIEIDDALALEFPSGVTSIVDTDLSDNWKLRRITLPSSISYIDDNTFSYESSLYCYVGYPVIYAKNNDYDYVVVNPEEKVDLSEEYYNEGSDMTFDIDTSSAYLYEYKDRSITITEWYGYTLQENIDYWWYDGGYGTIYIFGEGNYMGDLSISYEVKKLDLSKLKVTVNTKDVTYTGKAITKSVSLETSYGYKLCKDEDYTISYKNNKNTGKATIIISGTGDYFTGKITKTFKIVPRKATISSVKNSKKKSAKVTWKKDTQASGYEVYMATKKNGKYTKIKTVTSNKTTSYTKTKLKKNKTYYFKVRSYKTIDGKKVYGSYSSIKSVKIKK